MRHTLFVTPLEDPHVAAVLFQRLAQPQHVAVAKDGEDTFYEFMLFAIDVEKLVIKELHQRLRHCQSQFAHLAQSLLFSIGVWVNISFCERDQTLSLFHPFHPARSPRHRPFKARRRLIIPFKIMHKALTY